MIDGVLPVEQMLTVKAKQELDGGIPSAAVLIVETISSDGVGLAVIESDGSPPWHLLGMVHSARLSMEAQDVAGWTDED